MGTRDIPVLGSDPSCPTKGGREDGEGQICAHPRAISFSAASPLPFGALPLRGCRVPLCLWQLVMGSWSCPDSKSSLGGGLPPAWTLVSLKARPSCRSSMAPAAPFCRTGQLSHALHPRTAQHIQCRAGGGCDTGRARLNSDAGHLACHCWPEQLPAFCSPLHPSAEPACVPQEEQGDSIRFQTGAQGCPEVVHTKASVCAPLGLHHSAEASEVFACPLPA